MAGNLQIAINRNATAVPQGNAQRRRQRIRLQAGGPNQRLGLD